MVGKYLLIAAAAYLIGSVNSAILLVRLLYRQDVRASGSGNAGSTNVTRTYGSAPGLLTLLCDMLKAAAAGLLGRALAGQTGYMVGGLFCLVGHCWPLYFRFKGGKGMAVAAGMCLLLDWRVFLILGALFAVTFALWRRVSLSTIAAVAAFPPLYWLMARQADAVLALGTVMCLLVLFQHRENIRRLLNGTEPKLTIKGRKP